ncbi:MAG: type 1 glutamine amidotransferase [Thermodesulfobacteriota bacterium]
MYGNEILVLQHVKAEGPGLIGAAARAEGFSLRTIRLFAGEKLPSKSREYSALVVLGGPMGVYDEADYPYIGDELLLIKSAFRLKIPVLGVCLGAQMMARAAGAEVRRGGTKEIGFYSISLTPEGRIDSLLLGLPSEFTVFQWHGDTFDIPEGAENLAASADFENQLLKVGSNSYGLQFHIEVTEAMVRDFLLAGSDELRRAPYIKAPEVIMSEAREMLPAIHGIGRAIISRFLREVRQTAAPCR